MKLVKSILLVQALFCIACSSSISNTAIASDNSQFPAFNIDDYELIHRFYGKDKTFLGSAYAKYRANEVFTSMIILKGDEQNSEVLYFIDKTKLLKKDGIDGTVYPDGFWGYKVIMAKDDYIVINYLRNAGKNVSDDITIKWNYNEQKFQMLKTP